MEMTRHEFDDMMPRLRRRARRLSQNSAEAEDLCQEALLRLWQAGQDNRDIAEPGHYAMIVLHNLARREWRQRKPQAALTDDMSQEAPAAPARLACAEIARAIDALPPDQAVLMKQVAQGVTSPTQLAKQTGIPVGTVMSRLARARARLRTQMGLEIGAPIAELL